MRGPRGAFAVGLVALVATARADASPSPPVDPAPLPNVHDLDAIDRSAKTAYASGSYGFCTSPPSPLSAHGRSLCALADELEGCEGLKKACGSAPPPKDTSWMEQLVAWAAPIAKALLYVLVAAMVIAIAIPVVRAIMKRHRENRRIGPKPVRHVAVVDEPLPPKEEQISDAEIALRLADDLRDRGELDRALGLYLHASLEALDRRGAIRVARHRTNGEYVRACAEPSARAPLREIVRAVDSVQFGGATPTPDTVERVGTRAKAIVRAAAVATGLLVLLASTGCGTSRTRSDPAGDELPIDVLGRNGFRVGKLESSLATMPIPDPHEGSPVVIVDVERVPLEDETQAHLARWVEAGGVLVLFGRPADWPNNLRPRKAGTRLEEEPLTRDLVVETNDPNGGLEDLDAERDDQLGMPIRVTGARTARRDALVWAGSNPIAFLGASTYAAKKYVGKGIVLGVANDDLFTNVGVVAPRNAAALVTLVRSAAHDLRRQVTPGGDGDGALSDIRVARAEDGVPPPANPFAALLAAGLGKGAWHALVASLLLFLAYGIRHARARPLRPETRRAFAEHVIATGAFYGRARAHTHALAAYGRFLEARLREDLTHGGGGGAGGKPDPVALLVQSARSRGRPADPKRVAELYARATQATSKDPVKGDELAIIEELRRML